MFQRINSFQLSQFMSQKYIKIDYQVIYDGEKQNWVKIWSDMANLTIGISPCTELPGSFFRFAHFVRVQRRIDLRKMIILFFGNIR